MSPAFILPIVACIAACALTSSATIVAPRFAILLPGNDTLVTIPQVDLNGTGSPSATSVAVAVNGSALPPVNIVNGKWAARVPLRAGINKIRASHATGTVDIIVVRAPGMKERSPQRIFLSWDAGVDEELKKIARLSLKANPDAKELDDFVHEVKARVPAVMARFTQGVADVAVVSVDDPARAHVIHFRALDKTILGQSPLDCGNSVARQHSQVYVGTYRRNMTRPDDRNGFISGWAPMMRSDSIARRAGDVSNALARTAMHEVGHSLGLVADHNHPHCGWMDGCDEGHNCRRIDVQHPPANRFQNGWHLMDPGRVSENNARIAEASSTKRGPPRFSAFEPFGASYLRIIHPPR